VLIAFFGYCMIPDLAMPMYANVGCNDACFNVTDTFPSSKNDLIRNNLILSPSKQPCDRVLYCQFGN
jgi:hypothetical protein